MQNLAAPNVSVDNRSEAATTGLKEAPTASVSTQPSTTSEASTSVGRPPSGSFDGATMRTISSSTRRTYFSPTHRCLPPSTAITVACGTAAIITPIGELRWAGGSAPSTAGEFGGEVTRGLTRMEMGLGLRAGLATATPG